MTVVIRSVYMDSDEIGMGSFFFLKLHGSLLQRANGYHLFIFFLNIIWCAQNIESNLIVTKSWVYLSSSISNLFIRLTSRIDPILFTLLRIRLSDLQPPFPNTHVCIWLGFNFVILTEQNTAIMHVRNNIIIIYDSKLVRFCYTWICCIHINLC